MSASREENKIVNEKRTILAVGKTGVGKSKVLSKLIGKKPAVFKSSANTASCTDKVDSCQWEKVKFKIEGDNKEIHELTFELKAFDTPGIGDSKGRSKEFLNAIAETIKKEPLNMIIIFVEYGRLDVGLYNNLEILRECLNDLSQSSSMLIVNKVPTEKELERLRDEGEEEVLDRKVVLEETFKELSKALGNTFKYEFYLEAEGLEGAPANNDKQYELIRQVIYISSSHLDASRVRTWTEIKDWYEQDIDKLDDETVKIKTNQLKEDLKNKLDKVEFDIADIKYPFLKSKLIVSNSLGNFSTFEFISNFKCNLSKEELNKF